MKTGKTKDGGIFSQAGALENTADAVAVSASRVLVVNGERRKSAASDLSALLAELGVEASTVVAEHNGVIVEQARFIETGLAEGDVIELVRFVGGG